MHSTTARNLTSESMDLIGRCGLRLSSQRIAVASYILSHRTHPTADEIFNALKPDHPTLSRTTVYNTPVSYTHQRAHETGRKHL